MMGIHKEGVSKKCQRFYYKYIPDIKTIIWDGYVYENKAIQFLYTHWNFMDI